MRTRAIAVVAVGVTAAALVAGCSSSGTKSGSSGGKSGSSSSSSGGGSGSGKPQVGVILPDTTSSTRYTEFDTPLLTKAFSGAGIKSDIQNAGEVRFVPAPGNLHILALMRNKAAVREAEIAHDQEREREKERERQKEWTKAVKEHEEQRREVERVDRKDAEMRTVQQTVKKLEVRLFCVYLVVMY